MVLKRKRSESDFSSSSTSPNSSAFNSPTRNAMSTGMMDTLTLSSPLHPGSRPSRSVTPAHLPSRTMKRFRDGRPPANEVHQRTLNMLYTAQKQHHHQYQQHQQQQHQLPHPVPAHPPPPQSAQASLHSFWDLPSQLPSSHASPSAASPVVEPAIDAPAGCEDCGRGLVGSDDDDDDAMMDVDGFDAAGGGGVQTGCGACGKHVCSHCSITNLGERRRCLNCAGGTGWGGAGVSVC